MGRRKKDTEKFTVMLKRATLFTAQMLATRDGVDPRITGSNSAFLQWLMETYIKEFE